MRTSGGITRRKSKALSSAQRQPRNARSRRHLLVRTLLPAYHILYQPLQPIQSLPALALPQSMKATTRQVSTSLNHQNTLTFMRNHTCSHLPMSHILTSNRTHQHLTKSMSRRRARCTLMMYRPEKTPQLRHTAHGTRLQK